MYYYNFSHRLNESLSYGGNTKAVLSIGKIPMYIPKLDVIMDVELKPIVDCVEQALGEIMRRYEFMFEFIRYNRRMYVLTEPNRKECIHKTMAVDNKGNLWLNVFFIYRDLNNDVNRVFGILFHELMHNFLNHIDRGKKVFSMKDRMDLYKINPQMLSDVNMKMNLCMDLEVNLNMVADGVVSRDFWKEMHGMYDEKYAGKRWEEIYDSDGDSLLKDFKMASTSPIDEAYYEAFKAITKALKVLNDKYSSEADKERAAAELQDAIEKLLGVIRDSRNKMTIRNRLKKLQKTRIKEIGNIGIYLRDLIDDLVVSPKNMKSDELEKCLDDIKKLKDEMKSNVSEIAETFTCDEDDLSDDIDKCMDSLSDGIVKLNNPKISDIDAKEIESDIIFNIDRLLADDVKKKEIEEARKKKKEELKKKRDKKIAEEIEKKKKTHILYKYRNVIKSLQVIHDHERASEETAENCQNIIDMVEPLLDKPVDDIIASDIDGYKTYFENLKTSLYSDLMELKKSGIIIREDSYLKRITDEFYDFNIELFDNLSDGKLSPTELVGLIQNAIDSIRLIGKNLHTKVKYKASDEFKTAYKEEYNRLRKIYDELGEKALRKELGLI